MREGVRRDGEGGGPRPGDHNSVLTSLMGWMTRKEYGGHLGANRIFSSLSRFYEHKTKLL